MSQTIGGKEKGLKCQNCGEPYGWSEYFDYMLTLKSSTVDCFTCPAENYVVPGPFIKYLWLRVIGIILTLIIALLPIYLLSDVQITETEYSFRIPRLVIVLGISMAIGGYLAIMKTIHWNTGSLSLDPEFKSDADYDIY